jgi:hypothetical protein
MKLKQLFPFIAVLIITCFLSFSLFAQPTAGMLGHFKMDGNLMNNGSGSMGASPSGISYSTNNAGAPNKALMFAGSTGSYVSITDNGNLDFPGDFSIAFGIYLPSLASNQGFYDNGINYGGAGVWYFQSDNTLRFNFKNGSIGAPGALPANQWKAVCVVRNGSIIRIYVNGTQVASGSEGTSAISYPYAPVLGQMYFAGSGGNYNPVSNGAKLDELRFYNRALSAAEIIQLVGFSLPLKMGDFTASKQSAGIKLNWETLSEYNVSHFEIERSTDGTNFITIGSINATGNPVIKQFYTYTDGQPHAGTNLYRLKLADRDGAFTYSRVIALKNDGNFINIELFPNPVSNLLQVQLPSRQKETVSVSITDAAGRTVFHKQQQLSEGNNAISIQVQHFSKGTYYLFIDNQTGRQSKTFIKQ